MTAPDVFEYALVRVMPRVERGEAINVGVIVYSQAFRYLCARIELDEPRLLAVDPAADLDAVRAGLSAFEKACTEGPLAGRPLGERFRWLTAPRSRMSPSTVLMARRSLAATCSSRASCRGELSNTVTSAPAAASTGPC